MYFVGDRERKLGSQGKGHHLGAVEDKGASLLQASLVVVP